MPVILCVETRGFEPAHYVKRQLPPEWLEQAPQVFASGFGPWKRWRMVARLDGYMPSDVQKQWMDDLIDKRMVVQATWRGSQGENTLIYAVGLKPARDAMDDRQYRLWIIEHAFDDVAPQERSL